MKYLISFLVFAVAIVAGFWAYNHYGLGLNIMGFPLNPTEGQVFVKRGKSYRYTNGSWVAFVPVLSETERIRIVDTSINPEIERLKNEYISTLKSDNPNSFNNKSKRFNVNVKLSKYGIELTPFNDKEGSKELKVPKTMSIDNIFSREKNKGCETQYCCNGSGLFWCRAYQCKDPELGCRGCSGSCTNCNCTS